jgi:hypothetical protein
MKRLGVALAGIIGLVLLLGIPALAGDYHTGASLFCSQCHVMHGSQAHNYSPSGATSGAAVGIGGSGPYTYLLRNDINALCLSCHDGVTSIPDVFEANAASAATPVRQAGALNEDGTASTVYYEVTGHTLGLAATAPGGTWASDPNLGLTCTDCHQQHGYGGYGGPNPYRNVQYQPGSYSTGNYALSYTIGSTFDPNGTIADVHEYSSLSWNYDDVDFPEPSSTASGYGEWCGGCHSDFHGSATSTQIGGSGSPPEHFERHPTAGVDIGDVGGGHSSASVFADPNKVNWVKVMSNTGEWEPTASGDVTDHTPSCMTCHKAHGNKNAFGLIYMDPFASGGVDEEGAGTHASLEHAYRALCAQCHVQGG